MREIKFRAWSKDENKFYANVQNLYDYGHYGPDIPLFNFGELLKYQNEYTLEQCLNVKDKNGIEMYENDIVDIGETIDGCSRFLIKWNDKKLGFDLVYFIDEQNILYEVDFKYDVASPLGAKPKIQDTQVEIIGNIHQGLFNINETEWVGTNEE